MQQAFVTRPQHHHVVRHIVVLAVGTEVPDKQARRILALGNTLIGPVLAVLRLHQVPVGPSGVAIADHDVGGNKFAISQLHTSGAAAFDTDAGDRRVVADGHIARLQQMDQFAHDGAGAAHGRVHAPAPLQRMDECIHASD